MSQVATPLAEPMTPDRAFPGPRAFLPDEWLQFKGRDREIEDLHDLVLSYRVVLLYAKSGAGKTSLVNAGVLRRFAPEQSLVCRVGGALPPHLSPADVENIFVFNALASVLPGATGDAQTGGDKKSLSELTFSDLDPTIVVFDQFEELFTAHPERWQDREPFFRQLKDLLRARLAVHLLFVIREDHLAELDNYGRFLPDGLRIRYRLEALHQDQAAVAVREPAALCGFEFAPDVLEALIKDLLTVPIQTRDGVVQVEGEFVEPLHLQVVCRSLFSKLPPDRKVITHDDAHAFADVHEALAHFYNRALVHTVRETRVSEHKLRKWFDTEIITAAGTRGTVFAGEKMAGRIPVKAAQVLEREKLLRPEPRAGAVWYELTHDRFIGPIRESNQAFYRARTKRVALTVGLIVMFAYIAVLAAYLVTTQRQKADIAAVREKTQQETTNQLKATFNEEKQQAIQQVQAELTQQRRSAAVVARTLAAPSGPSDYPDTARSEAALGLSEAALGNLTSASAHFQRVRQSYVMLPIRLLDKAISDAELHKDAALANLKIARRDYLKSLDPFKDVSSALRAYACEHNAFVIGASDRVPAAADELKRWQRTYPYAELGVVTPSNANWVPIIVESFLTCDQARRLISDLKSKDPRSAPFVGAWYPQCPACSGVPRRLGERNPVGRNP